ncbi:hypothetical protein HU200_007957 [Digitaria exilis]|uniref:Uncharacterized protein n=1 Tax=Digitaria exilis TaxID=1010633 RepID=A0A835FMK7_9POAL|nr:hypothetical protein HU200_007957 [Digitaria exilis]
MVGSSAAHTMSTISIEELHGSHVLTIKGYTKTKGLAAGGHRWYNAGYVSLYLELVGTNNNVKARLDFTLLDTKGKPVPSYCYNTSSIKTFSFKGYLLKRSLLFGPARPDAEVCVWAMIYFVYTDSVPEVVEEAKTKTTTMAQGLVAAADRYGLERLKLMWRGQAVGVG